MPLKYDLKYQPINFYGFDHAEVNKKFTGGLTYLGDITIASFVVAAVYKAKNPDKSKGHKKYMLLYRDVDGAWFVSGMTPNEMKNHRKVNGLLCKSCNMILVSLHRHDLRRCGCDNAAFVDGGRDYSRVSAVNLKLTKSVKVDLLTGEVS